MPDYIPQSDADFDTWASNFDNALTAAPTAYGETSTTAGVLDSAVGAWHDAYTNHLNEQVTARALAETKDTKRAAAENLIRAMAGRMQAWSGMTDTKREETGLTVRDTTRTPAPAPTSIPVLSIDTSVRWQHMINFADQGTPTTKAKPAGVMGIEIWVKAGGPPPTSPSECEFLAIDTRTPYLAIYDSSQGGTIMHYIGRWLSTRQAAGGWSETVSSTVGA